jgi:hypothetical protein
LTKSADLTKSIITKCCYEVTDESIKDFFMNAGLRAAWEKVSPLLPLDTPVLNEVFKHIEAIRQHVSPPGNKSYDRVVSP